MFTLVSILLTCLNIYMKQCTGSILFKRKLQNVRLQVVQDILLEFLHGVAYKNEDRCSNFNIMMNITSLSSK